MKNIKLFLFFILSISLATSMMGCGGGSSGFLDASLSAQNCGNSLLNEGEACDDGNVNNSDGCNAHCAWEVGEAICGNAVLENDECCDDGNNISGDACSADCVLEGSNHSPSPPVLLEQPASGVIWAPTRLYLSWNPSTDPDKADAVVYDVYFSKGNAAAAIPYKKGLADTHFIIQASTDNRTKYFPDEVSPIYLSPPSADFDGQYIWKVCARDQHGAQSCSESRIFRTDDSVVGWWRFDEDPHSSSVCEGEELPSGKICDHSSKKNHGIIQGTVSWLPPIDTQVMEGAFDFNDNYILVPHSSSLNLSSRMSAEVVQNLKAFGGTTDRPFLSKLSSAEASDNTGYAFSIGRGTDLYLWIGNRLVGRSFAVATNEWSHFIATYDGTTARLYQDHQLLSEQAIAGAINSNVNPLWIGHSLRFNSFYKGSISDLLIYSRNLSGEEIENSFWISQEDL